jgi:hypothetical protein
MIWIGNVTCRGLCSAQWVSVRGESSIIFILAELLAIYCLNFLFGKKCTYIISYLKQKETIILWILLL